MIHDGVNVGDDAVVRSSVDSLQEVLFGTPLGTPRALLLKLPQVPNVIAARLVSTEPMLAVLSDQLTCRSPFLHFRQVSSEFQLIKYRDLRARALGGSCVTSASLPQELDLTGVI